MHESLYFCDEEKEGKGSNSDVFEGSRGEGKGEGRNPEGCPEHWGRPGIHQGLLGLSEG